MGKNYQVDNHFGIINKDVDKSPTAEVNKDYFQPESVHGVVEKSKNRDNRKRTFDSSLSDGGVSQRGKNPKIEALMNEIIKGNLIT